MCEGEEEGIAELVNSVKTKAPALSKVEDLQIKYGEYAGEFLDFERRGEDVPRKATLDDILNVMKSFDSKAENIVGVLGEIKSDTSQIRQDTAQIPNIVENTSLIPQIVENTSFIPQIVENTSLIHGMKEDTAAIRVDTREIATKLWQKYEELSKEIAQMKITLSRIEAKVFG